VKGEIMRVPFHIVIVSLCVSACERDPLPANVRKLVAMELADDGKIHISRIGRLKITPRTVFCSSRNYFTLDGRLLAGTLVARAQSASPERTNAISGESAKCSSKDAITILGLKEENLHGKPYRLVLALWQNQSAWVGTLSRPDGIRPGLSIAPAGAYFGFSDANKERRSQISIEMDLQDLSRQFLKNADWGI